MEIRNAEMDLMKQMMCVTHGHALKDTGNVALMNVSLLLVFVIITKCTLLSVLMDQMSLNISVQHGSALKGIGNVALVNVFMQRMFVTNNLAAQMHQMNQMKCVLSGSAREVTGDVTPMNV